MKDAERWTTTEVHAVDDGFIATLVPAWEEF
jgi:hypothetical protein